MYLTDRYVKVSRFLDFIRCLRSYEATFLSKEREREKFLINWRFERHLLAKDERERKERRRGGYFRRKRRR